MTTATEQNERLMRSVTSRTIKYLFASFHATYGSKWSSQIPEELWPAAQEQWLRVLSKFEPVDIRRGFDAWDKDWPPNVFEFEKVCRKPASVPYHKMLEPPKPERASKEIAEENVSKIKDMIEKARIVKEL